MSKHGKGSFHGTFCDKRNTYHQPPAPTLPCCVKTGAMRQRSATKGDVSDPPPPLMLPSAQRKTRTQTPMHACTPQSIWRSEVITSGRLDGIFRGRWDVKLSNFRKRVNRIDAILQSLCHNAWPRFSSGWAKHCLHQKGRLTWSGCPSCAKWEHVGTFGGNCK